MTDESNLWSKRFNDDSPPDWSSFEPQPTDQATEQNSAPTQVPGPSSTRWSSPSMGSYDPAEKHEALNPDETDASEKYFRSYGYGDEFGDGLLNDAVAEGAEADALAQAETRRTIIEWAVVFVGALILALFLRYFLVQAFWIPTSSMETTLLVNDRVLVNKLSYQFGDIGRGDIVVFHRTDADLAANPRLHPDVIKRVIAFEGETIEIYDNLVHVNGEPLDEPYLDAGTNNLDFGPIVVPESQLFVMGDNREGSADSRSQLGTVEEDRVVGRAFGRFGHSIV